MVVSAAGHGRRYQQFPGYVQFILLWLSFIIINLARSIVKLLHPIHDWCLLFLYNIGSWPVAMDSTSLDQTQGFLLMAFCNELPLCRNHRLELTNCKLLPHTYAVMYRESQSDPAILSNSQSIQIVDVVKSSFDIDLTWREAESGPACFKIQTHNKNLPLEGLGNLLAWPVHFLCSGEWTCGFFHLQSGRPCPTSRGCLSQDPKYRTVLCWNWKNGRTCPWGDECSYAHGDKELRLPQKSHVPCKFHVLGTCQNGEHCRFSHSWGDVISILAQRITSSSIWVKTLRVAEMACVCVHLEKHWCHLLEISWDSDFERPPKPPRTKSVRVDLQSCRQAPVHIRLYQVLKQ